MKEADVECSCVVRALVYVDAAEEYLRTRYRTNPEGVWWNSRVRTISATGRPMRSPHERLLGPNVETWCLQPVGGAHATATDRSAGDARVSPYVCRVAGRARPAAAAEAGLHLAGSTAPSTTTAAGLI